MARIGRFWASASVNADKVMVFNAKAATLRRLDIAGVASSVGRAQR